MAEVYATLIIYGTKKFTDVPAKLQPAVHTDLLALGLDDTGNPIVA